jgi:hypothetical protein
MPLTIAGCAKHLIVTLYDDYQKQTVHTCRVWCYSTANPSHAHSTPCCTVRRSVQDIAQQT